MAHSDHTGESQSRVFAESYILRCIDRFDARAQDRLIQACPGAPYKTADDALNDFSRAESPTEAAVQWVLETWEKRPSQSLEDARRFAAEVAPRVFPDYLLED
jgi:hypothetical protein